MAHTGDSQHIFTIQRAVVLSARVTPPLFRYNFQQKPPRTLRVSPPHHSQFFLVLIELNFGNVILLWQIIAIIKHLFSGCFFHYEDNVDCNCFTFMGLARGHASVAEHLLQLHEDLASILRTTKLIN